MKYSMLKDLAPWIQIEGCVYELKCELSCWKWDVGDGKTRHGNKTFLVQVSVSEYLKQI